MAFQFTRILFLTLSVDLDVDCNWLQIIGNSSLSSASQDVALKPGLAARVGIKVERILRFVRLLASCALSRKTTTVEMTETEIIELLRIEKHIVLVL